MTPTPLPTTTPGIYRCPACGLRNPRPIKKPFHHQCGPRQPIVSADPPPPIEPPDSAPIAVIANRILNARGGGTVSWHALAETLMSRGLTVWGVSSDRVSNAPPGMRTWQVPPRRLDFVLDSLPATPAVILCNSDGVPHVHPAAQRHGIPFVVYVQFWRGLVKVDPAVLRHLDEGGLPPDAIEQDNLAKIADAAAVVANSHYTADVVERLTGHACEVVRPYIREPGLNGHAREPEYILLPSAQYWKGAGEFFALARRNPQLPFLVLAGDNMISAAAVAEAETIPNITVHTEWIDDMRPIYAKARALFVGTTTCETFCRTAAEARACGVPILALKAGNLPNIVRDDGGVCVPREATIDEWQTAFERVLAMDVKPTNEFVQDDRPHMADVIDGVRRLPEVYMPLPYRGGIRAVVQHAARVLGATVLPWDAPARQFAEARLIVCPWQVPDRLLRLGVPIWLWWHSHCAQMDITRNELTGLAKAWECVEANPQLDIAFGNRAEAELWQTIHPGRSHYLPACLDCRETTVAKTGGVFIPGPYGIRKNTPTALAACRMADRSIHVTGRFREHEDLLRFAVALDCRLHIHDCPTVADVSAVAGACDVGLVLSTAETFCYAAAECVLAGTPVIGWKHIPAIAGVDRPWLVDDPSDVAEVAAKILAVSPEWIGQQREGVRAVAGYRAMAARRVLLNQLRQHVSAGEKSWQTTSSTI